MTWDELRRTLSKAGLHRIDEGVAADTGALFVTGLAWDSRAVEPGNVFIALKGLRADGNLVQRLDAVDPKVASKCRILRFEVQT